MLARWCHLFRSSCSFTSFRSFLVLLLLGVSGLYSSLAMAFCGFYVGKADSSLFNTASQVIVARDGNRTVVSMQSDYKGAMKEFALVVPVPQVLQKGQVNVGDNKIFDRLDAYSAPRLVEYFDPDPCRPMVMEAMAVRAPAPMMKSADASSNRARALGVTIEASYSVGEYDILILSAKQSDGLSVWLRENGYNVPKKIANALQPYIRQDMKFFVAKVNLQKQAATGLVKLRPLQFAYESNKFMLPIRLGMANAEGPQDMIIYMLSTKGRVETSNYRTVKLPADQDLPVFLKETGEFAKFYKALWEEQQRRESNAVVFTEYFWDMSWCDPCAADPLSPDELRAAGVFWTQSANGGNPGVGKRVRPIMPPSNAPNVMVTRLHVRYQASTFPEDLMFQETNDRQNFQARYVLRHPWNGDKNACPEAKPYFQEVAARQNREAEQYANLTGAPIADVRRRMSLPAKEQGKPWWSNLWKSDE